MSVRDYILYCAHGRRWRRRWCYCELDRRVGFPTFLRRCRSHQHRAPNTIDGTTGDGCGCIYMSGMEQLPPYGTATISLNTGIGIFYTGFQGVIENCNIGGGYKKGDDLNKSIGIFTRGSNIRNGKYANLSTAICLIAGPSIVEFLDIERCGIGIRVGYNPITYWESNANNLWVPQNNPTGPIGSVIKDDHDGKHRRHVCLASEFQRQNRATCVRKLRTNS